jgi:hypothetical protein
MHNNDGIHTIPCPDCKICGSPGVSTYQGLQDRLFSTSGFWNLKKCSNAECGIMWLDPMPLESDIHKAYTSYYTHDGISPKENFIIRFIAAKIIAIPYTHPSGTESLPQDVSGKHQTGEIT